ncbi:MAG: hypothetical protein M5U26_23765 [Planctomycetota bacterium]|nr:hypothetical protein [Planctomycetota bacterium]
MPPALFHSAIRMSLFIRGLLALPLLALGALGALGARAGEAEPPKPVEPPAETEKPITTASGELGDLLKAWWKEGSAAGNVGDRYDNRDRTHSMLNLKPYPQLVLHPYTEQERTMRADWALQGRILPGIVFGNSSTSAGMTGGGSNPRHAYSTPRGALLLYGQYRKNNLYMYPEHRDHDPAPEGHGDVYPLNTPYVLISQGSSGTDQPFMRAVPFALAAFRPEVKKKLADEGFLMPTLQMLLRRTNKHIKDDAEYLSGKAHPTVFEGAWVDPLAMVKLAHELTLETLPPLVQLKVLEESEPKPWIDYFDPHPSERLAETPCAIGRVFRGPARERRMVVSAAESRDLNGKPLTFRWVVLRGDAEAIRIAPRNEAGSEVELVVPHHPRRPSAGPGSIESSRVDIGVFAHNGAYWSAPAFVTFFALDQELRAYDAQGRVLEIGYDAGPVELKILNWGRLLALLAPEAGDCAAKLLKETLGATAAEALAKLSAGYEPLREKAAEADRLAKAADAARNEARKAEDEARKRAAEAKKKAEAKPAPAAAKTGADSKTTESEQAPDAPDADGVAAKQALETAEAALKTAQAARAEADKAAGEARKVADEAQAAVNAFLDSKPEGLDGSPRALLTRALEGLLRDPEFYPARQAELDAAMKDNKKAGPVGPARKLLAAYRIVKSADGPFELSPLRAEGGTLAERLTPYERMQLERFNLILLTQVLYPGLLSGSAATAYVDPRISVRKTWRDVYRHDAQGRIAGFTRYTEDGATEFHADGWIVSEKDELGRPTRALKPDYDQAQPKDPRQRYPNFNPITFKAAEDARTYAYAGEDDLIGTGTDVKPEPKPAEAAKTEAAQGEGEKTGGEKTGASKTEEPKDLEGGEKEPDRPPEDEKDQVTRRLGSAPAYFPCSAARLSRSRNASSAAASGFSPASAGAVLSSSSSRFVAPSASVSFASSSWSAFATAANSCAWNV